MPSSRTFLLSLSVLTALATPRALAAPWTMFPILAHPGHGAPEIQDGLLHYVASPLHALPWLSVVLMVAAISLAAAKLRRRRKMQKVAATRACPTQSRP